MAIESDKPVKTCPYCKKSVVNLGLHIINAHPTIMEQLEERQNETTPQKTSFDAEPRPKPINVVSEDTETLIRRKLSMLMDIQIIKALGAGAELKHIQAMITPAKTAQETINEAIALHNAIYPPNQRNVVDVVAEATDTNQWLELAKVALPAIAQMLPQKRTELQNEVKTNDAEHRTIEERSVGVRRLVSTQNTGNTGQPSNISREPSVANGAEQQDSRSVEPINKGNRGE